MNIDKETYTLISELYVSSDIPYISQTIEDWNMIHNDEFEGIMSQLVGEYLEARR